MHPLEALRFLGSSDLFRRPAPTRSDLVVRLAALALGCAGVWLSRSRRPLPLRLALTLALLFAALTWAPPLLAMGAVAAVLLVALGLVRRKSDALDALLARAAGGPEQAAGAPAGAPARDSWRRSLAWCLGGLLLLAAGLTILEIRQPYYFCQDDMLVGETPALLQGLRSVWAGVFPEWDGHVLMGVPYASAGGGRLFYPPTYLAYAIARHLLGNEMAQVDVAAVLHIVATYFVIYGCLRRLGAGAAVAAAGGLSVALSGPTLIMGRCWAMFLYGTVWAPLLFYAVARLGRGPVGWRWVLLTGGGVGVLFQIGFVQLWVTVLLLMGIAALHLRLAGRVPNRRLLSLAAAVTLGAALAAPLMYQQWALTRDLHAGHRSDNGVAPGLLAMLLPYPLATAPHPAGWGGLDAHYMGQMYYFGTTFALLALLGLAALLTPRRSAKREVAAPDAPAPDGSAPTDPPAAAIAPARRLWGANLWLVMALFVLVLALGSDGGVWQVMSALPVLNVVNHYPFRLLPFLALFAVFAGAAVAERLLRATPRRARWEAAGAAATAGLLLWHVWFARSSFYQYGFRPTQPLPAALAGVLGGNDPHPRGRLMAWAPDRSCLPEFRDTMKLNLPLLDGVPSFTGYDPLTTAKSPWMSAERAMGEDPVLASRVYGVRWHVVSRLIAHPTFSGDSPAERFLESWVPLGRALTKLEKAPLRRVARLPEAAVHELPDIDPLAFPAGRPAQPLPLTLSNRGVDVDLSALPEGGQIVVNWLWYPPMRAVLEAGPGTGAACPCAADAWGRIVVNVPPAAATAPAGTARTLRVRYAPDWGTGIALGCVLAAIALGATAWLERTAASANSAASAPSRTAPPTKARPSRASSPSPAARRVNV